MICYQQFKGFYFNSNRLAIQVNPNYIFSFMADFKEYSRDKNRLSGTNDSETYDNTKLFLETHSEGIQPSKINNFKLIQ